MRMVDRDGKHLEVILLDRGRGPQQWIRVSWHGILLGAGYYRTVDEALRFVDVESLVEVIPLPRDRSLTASRTAARNGGTAVSNAATASIRAAAESMDPIVRHATGRHAGRSAGRSAVLFP